jgi:hypothetical protein
MAFVGKLAYLLIFPGLLSVVMAGYAARFVLAGMKGAMTGGYLEGPTTCGWSSVRQFASESIATGGSLNAVGWCAPVIKLLALSWVSCIALSFLGGDVVLLFALLVLAAAADLLLVFSSANPRVLQNAPGEALWVLGWAVPLALVFAGVALRTGEVGVAALARWQVANGVMVASASGGALAQAGSALGLAAALVCGLSMARMRPLGRGLFDDPPGGVTSDLSGPPLAILRLADTAALIVVPLVLVLLFFAGPYREWYEIAFWGLKVLGLLIVLGAVDLVFPRMRSSRAFIWSLALAGTLALAGLGLIWAGVSV